MIRILSAAVLSFCLLSSAAAQTSLAETEIDAAWKICEPHEVHGRIAVQHPWQDGWDKCEAVKNAYVGSAAGIEAKKAADKDAADKLRIEGLANRLKGGAK